MSQFMVEFDLPEFTFDFVALIPAQRTRINQLLEEGKLQSYMLAADRGRLWCIVNAEQEIDVWRIIDTFPLIQYMEAHIHELMFHNSVVIYRPTFSDN